MKTFIEESMPYKPKYVGLKFNLQGYCSSNSTPTCTKLTVFLDKSHFEVGETS